MFGRMKKKDWDRRQAFGKAMSSYYRAMSSFVFNDYSIEEKIDVIDYLMRLIKIDLASNRKLDSIYGLSWEDDLFPDSFKIGVSKKVKGVQGLGIVQEFPLNEQTYISTWKPISLLDIFKDVKKTGFKADCNHRARYYQELDWLQVYNGKHSATAGTVLGGLVPAEIVSIKNMYDHIWTDGAYWYCPESFGEDKRVWKTIDFRVAVLYELSKDKYELLKQG